MSEQKQGKKTQLGCVLYCGNCLFYDFAECLSSVFQYKQVGMVFVGCLEIFTQAFLSAE